MVGKIPGQLVLGYPAREGATIDFHDRSETVTLTQQQMP